MTTIALESIKAEHIKPADLIAAFEKQQEPSALFFPEVTINLASGEHYAGIVIGKDGEPSYHLVLLPGQADDITRDKAMEWAGKQGGEYVASLPTRREQALLYANLKEEFEERAYWSCEAHESDSGWAWFQYFSTGSQRYDYRYGELRARAVRRVPINLDSGFAVKFEDYCKLETELAAKDEVIAEAGEMLAMRDRQLAALKTELREICAAIDDPASDLTLTAVECIKKLKAENESLKRSAERYQWLRSRLNPKDISIIRMRNDLYPELDYEVDIATDAAMKGA